MQWIGSALEDDNLDLEDLLDDDAYSWAYDEMQSYGGTVEGGAGFL